MIHMKRLYQYEDDEGTWFEERSPLTEEEMKTYGIVYKGHTWVEEDLKMKKSEKFVYWLVVAGWVDVVYP